LQTPLSDHGEPRPGVLARGVQRVSRWIRRLAFLLAILAVFTGIGFVLFANSIPREEEKLGQKADAIVVLTGGASRIVDAIELLAAGHGKKLLISGVNPNTSRAELVKTNPEFERLFDCCIDLGHRAQNTIGNAFEASRWVRERKFNSVILVTSGWHMPRALVETEKELPGVKLIPHAVISEKMREQPWWSDPATARLLFVEYVKYIVAYVRVRIDPLNIFGRIITGER
jgi:uncharacterized SAM-binding protein YcdF (DUF218 family)